VFAHAAADLASADTLYCAFDRVGELERGKLVAQNQMIRKAQSGLFADCGERAKRLYELIKFVNLFHNAKYKTTSFKP
jgi:hypothetical protein